MDKKINLSQLADLLAEAGGMSKTASEQFVKSFFEIISNSVLKDGLVKVKGLGTFKLVQMEDRESVNVNTGQRFTIEGHQKISFTPDSELKERINKPFSSFDVVELTDEQAAELSKMDSENSDQTQTASVTDVAVSETAGKEESIMKESDEKVEPVVKEVTQKKGTRFLLRLLIWILCIVLVVPVAIYLFWPLIGNRILASIEDGIKPKDNTEYVVTATAKDESVVTPQESVTPQEQVESEKPIEPEKPVEPEQPVIPEQPAKPQEPVVPAQPVSRQASAQATAQAQYPAIQLNSRDQAKDLSAFTEADTVNFRMDGQLAEHTLKKGETITMIALQYYGTKKLWPYIVKYNNIKKPESLRPGAKIRIPVLKAK